MRKYQKTQCLEALASLNEAGEQLKGLPEKLNREEALGLLEDYQQTAIQLGTLIEQLEGEGTETVRLLEDYCELIYQIHEDLLAGQPSNLRQQEKKLRKLLARTESEIRYQLPTRYEAVFLPYKASMWDSLESIWMAADADPDCDTYVVPIPYFDKNPDGSFARIYYEADQYPEYVPVYDFREYDLDARHPDMVFIHNPYDEFNYVTSVHPDYYSHVLRDKTECLVYVPYYATSGYLADGHDFLSAYAFCDYIVVQSEPIVGFFDKRIPRNKFLPLGSPKFDRVIRLCNDPPGPPAEWAEKLKGKRTFFFNTSLSGFLGDTEVFLKKMAYVFDVFKEQKDACLIWRPHPLLRSTLDSMRPDSIPVYEALRQYFLENDIGILDETPDIEKTIALSDAYLGDSGTSVTSLFGVAGKPMYILNNYLHSAPGEEDWKAWVAKPVRGDRNDRYCLALGNNLFEDKNRDGHYRFVCKLPGEYSGGGYYGSVLEAQGKIIAFPVNGEDILVMDPKDFSSHKIKLKHEEERGGVFAGPVNLTYSDHPEIYYLLPNRYSALVRFNAKTEKVDYLRDEAFSDEFSVFVNERQERILAPRFFRYDEGPCPATETTRKLPSVLDPQEFTVTAPDGTKHPFLIVSSPEIPGISLKGLKLICIDQTGKRLRAIQMETLEVQERSIGLDGMYIGVLSDIHDPEVFWFIPYRGTVLCKWDLSTDTFAKVDAAVEGIRSIKRPQRYDCDEHFFSNALYHQGKLLLAPGWGNKFVELDVHTHEAKEWDPPFPYTTEDKNDYWRNGNMGFFWRDAYDFSDRFYYAPEHLDYELDLEHHTCSLRESGFEKDDIFSLAAGFHRESQWMPYCCLEDLFNSLSDIASGNIHGPAFDRTAQIEAYKQANASPDGDCGEKVYRRLKKG